MVYVGRTTNLLDLQEQQETCMYMYMYGESLFALTLTRLGMSIRWQSNSIPIKAWLVYGALQIENNKR